MRNAWATSALPTLLTSALRAKGSLKTEKWFSGCLSENKRVGNKCPPYTGLVGLTNENGARYRLATGNIPAIAITKVD